MKPSAFVFRSSLVAALGGLLFGFDTAVISGTIDGLQSQFDLTPTGKGFAVASALIGTVIGSIAVGRPTDRFGRRATMFALAALYFVSAVGCALAWDLNSLLVFRLIGGLGVGGASVVSPMYIAEISPARIRGRLVALAQFNIVFGVLLAYLSNYVVAQLHTGGFEWRIMFGVEAIPAAAYFVLLFGVPRSPRWLVAQTRVEEARAVLHLVGTDEGTTVDGEITAIQDSLASERDALKEPFFQRKYSKPIFLAVAIAMFNQLSGINAILYYAPDIFKAAGLGKDAALLNSVGIGFVNLLVTMLALAVIDNFGRRRLMIVGSIGYIVSLGAVAWAFYTQGTTGPDGRGFTSTGSTTVLIGLIVFIGAHAFGQGAVIWVFISEIFPNSVRARGQALGTFTHWIMAAVISQTFPMIAEAAGGHVFAFYAICMIGQLIWVLTLMPETKGVPLEQIERTLGIE